MFPIWKAPPAEKDLAWVVVYDGSRKTYPIRDLVQTPVLMETIADKAVVLLTDPESRAVRVYQAQGLQFHREQGQFRDDQGRIYRESETALTSDDGTNLVRLSGHRTFWFSCGAFFPDTGYYRKQP